MDEAEHHGKPALILRHGKPAAAIVPVAVALLDLDVTSALVRAGVPLPWRAAISRTISRRAGRDDWPPRDTSDHRGRGSDEAPRRRATYGWVASSKGLLLVTLDDAIAEKTSRLCRVERP